MAIGPTPDGACSLTRGTPADAVSHFCRRPIAEFRVRDARSEGFGRAFPLRRLRGPIPDCAFMILDGALAWRSREQMEEGPPSYAAPTWVNSAVCLANHLGLAISEEPPRGHTENTLPGSGPTPGPRGCSQFRRGPMRYGTAGARAREGVFTTGSPGGRRTESPRAFLALRSAEPAPHGALCELSDDASAVESETARFAERALRGPTCAPFRAFGQVRVERIHALRRAPVSTFQTPLVHQKCPGGGNSRSRPMGTIRWTGQESNCSRVHPRDPIRSPDRSRTPRREGPDAPERPLKSPPATADGSALPWPLTTTVGDPAPAPRLRAGS
jgi:hypothetical protein